MKYLVIFALFFLPFAVIYAFGEDPFVRGPNCGLAMMFGLLMVGLFYPFYLMERK
jgi:hypothetical protein